MKTIKIKIENYPQETPELRETFKALGLQSFDSLHFQFKMIEAGTYHVETKRIFSNQYNTTEGFRIFEKCSCLSTPSMKKLRGYYIAEGIEKIREYQATVRACGYCGAQYIGLPRNFQQAQTFCDKCLDSQYLEKKDLHLLRLHFILDKNDREPLTEGEEAWLMPQYIERQTKGENSRNAKHLRDQRARIEADFKKDTENAKAEHDGLIWLMDNNVSIDNVIYYNHTKRFCFGWRHPVGADVKSELLDLLCEFPFDYDIK
ncbi:MAG: hypothetical protein GY841_23540 [FCB group bacterium]|nr:hypothetical protein [FCB group bacterium]